MLCLLLLLFSSTKKKEKTKRAPHFIFFPSVRTNCIFSSCCGIRKCDMYCTPACSHGKRVLSTQPIDLSWEVGGLTDRPIWGGVISILIYCNGLLSLLLLSLSLSVTPSSSSSSRRCDVFWSSKMKPGSVLSFLRRRGSHADCNYFLPGTGSVWRTKCTQNTLVTIRLACTKYVPRAHTHTHTEADKHTITSAQAHFHTHTHYNKLQLLLLVVLSCCDYSQRESDLLINATNAVCFLAI